KCAVELIAPLRVAKIVVGVSDQQGLGLKFADPVPVLDMALAMGGEYVGIERTRVAPVGFEARSDPRIRHDIVEEYDIELRDVTKKDCVVAFCQPLRPAIAFSIGPGPVGEIGLPGGVFSGPLHFAA